MKLSKGQNENNDSCEEGGEEDENSNPSEEGDEERTATLENQDKNSCCPCEYKYLFSFPMDEKIVMFSNSPSNSGHRKGT